MDFVHDSWPAIHIWSFISIASVELKLWHNKKCDWKSVTYGQTDGDNGEVIPKCHLCLQQVTQKINFIMKDTGHFQSSRAADKMRKINFNQQWLHYFLTNSYVWPLVRIVSMRRFSIQQVVKHRNLSSYRDFRNKNMHLIWSSEVV